jgi:hypothetical protein
VEENIAKQYRAKELLKDAKTAIEAHLSKQPLE